MVPFPRVCEIASDYGLALLPRANPLLPRTHCPAAGSLSCDVWALGMHECITEVCLKDSTLANLRSPMGVMGPKSPGRGATIEEWKAIGVYMCAIWEKS